MFVNYSFSHHIILNPIFRRSLYIYFINTTPRNLSFYIWSVIKFYIYTPYISYISSTIDFFIRLIDSIIINQFNIFTRSHKKNKNNNNNNNNNKEKKQSTEISIISKNKTISQNIFLSGFSIEQTQSFNIFINEII